MLRGYKSYKKAAKEVKREIECDKDFCKPGNRNWSAVDWLIATTMANMDENVLEPKPGAFYADELSDVIKVLNGANKAIDEPIISETDYSAMIDKFDKVMPYLEYWCEDQDLDVLASKSVRYVFS
nr:MAG TPA: hypothetical protein [Caudoviricetes sp.]